MGGGAEEKYCCLPSRIALSVEHLALHLPRRELLRKVPAFMMKGPDAAENLCGALVHVDGLEMRHGSDAYQSAQRALVFTDDLTLLLGALLRFDDVPRRTRRLWSDRGAELVAASKYIRTLRPFADFTNTPLLRLCRRPTGPSLRITIAPRHRHDVNHILWPLMLEKFERIRSNVAHAFEHRGIDLRDSDLRSEAAMQSLPHRLALRETSRDHQLLCILEKYDRLIPRTSTPSADEEIAETAKRPLQRLLLSLKRCFDDPCRTPSLSLMWILCSRGFQSPREMLQHLKAIGTCKALLHEWAWQASPERPDSYGGCRFAKVSQWHRRSVPQWTLRNSSSTPQGRMFGCLDKPWGISEFGSHSQGLNRLLPSAAVSRFPHLPCPCCSPHASPLRNGQRMITA